MSVPTETKRIFFLDNLKLFFVILVVFYHAAVTYGVEGWWYYLAHLNENNSSTIQLLNEVNSLFFLLLTVIGALFQSSLMGLFFLLGGFFTPGSYERRGPRSYWKSRLSRLGIPLVLYIVLIDPLMVYSLAILGVKDWNTFSSLQGSFLDFYFSRFQSINGVIEFLSSTGPMWFLTVLLLLTFGYTIWTQIAQLEPVNAFVTRENQIPSIIVLFLVSLVLGILTFIIRLFFPVGDVILGIPFAFSIQYAMMFIVGLIAYRYEWFEKMTISQGKKWGVIILASASFFVFYLIFIFGLDSDLTLMAGSFTIHALVYSMVDNIICMGMIFVIIPIVRDNFNIQGDYIKKMSSNAYIMYLLHAPMLVLVSLLMASIVLLPFVKLFLASIATIIFCFLISHYLIKRIIDW